VVSIFGGIAGSLAVLFGRSRWLGEVWKAKIPEKVHQDNRKQLAGLESEMRASVEKANRLVDARISKAILVTTIEHIASIFSQKIYRSFSAPKRNLFTNIFFVAQQLARCAVLQ
jgi:hypothetical protein